MKNKVYNLSIYSTVPDEAQKELENLTPLHFAAKYGDAMFITTTIAALDDSQKKKHYK